MSEFFGITDEPILGFVRKFGVEKMRVMIKTVDPDNTEIDGLSTAELENVLVKVLVRMVEKTVGEMCKRLLSVFPMFSALMPQTLYDLFVQNVERSEKSGAYPKLLPIMKDLVDLFIPVDDDNIGLSFLVVDTNIMESVFGDVIKQDVFKNKEAMAEVLTLAQMKPVFSVDMWLYVVSKYAPDKWEDMRDSKVMRYIVEMEIRNWLVGVQGLEGGLFNKGSQPEVNPVGKVPPVFVSPGSEANN